MNHRVTLVATAIALNAILFASYARLNASPSDFGEVRENLRLYMLITAAISNVCILAFVGIISVKGDATNSQLTASTLCLLAYYGLLLFFLPAVRIATEHGGSRNYARALLLACIIPVSILAGIGVQLRDYLLVALGILTTLHVTVNDAILYGFLF